MTQVCIITPRGDRLADVRVAETFWTRFRGLMFRRQIDEDDALLFPNCGSIHTFGMLTRIDVAFLRQGIVERVVAEARPNRIYATPGCDVLELAPGSLSAAGVRVGDRLRLLSSGEGERVDSAARLNL